MFLQYLFIALIVIGAVDILKNSLKPLEMKKVFDERGTDHVSFGINNIAGIESWLGIVAFTYAVQFAKKVDDDPVFGEAYHFPCKIID